MFSNEFVAGMTTRAPQRASWATSTRTRPSGGSGAARAARGSTSPCCSTRATTPALRAARATSRPRGSRPAGSRCVTGWARRDLDDFEHFGFRDGISQPFVEGLSKTGPPETDRPRRASSSSATRTSTASTPAGRCSTPPADPAGLLPRDAEGSGRADLGRNGSYLVLRQLRQDVPGFWRFVDRATRRADGTSDPQARLRLAAKMVGRWPSGAPLALAPDADDPSLAERERLRLPRARPARRPLPGRRRTSAAPTRATRSTRSPGIERLAGDQPPPPHPAPRPRVRHVADDRRGARRRRRRPSAG